MSCQCAVAGIDDGLQCFALMLDVAFGRFNQIGDQVISAFELDVDLRKRIFVTVPKRHQAVVNADHNDDGQQNDSTDNNCCSHFILLVWVGY